MLGNRADLDFLLAEQGGVYPVSHTSCCTWANTSGDVGTELDKVRAQTMWLSAVATDPSWFFDLFSWLLSGITFCFG